MYLRGALGTSDTHYRMRNRVLGYGQEHPRVDPQVETNNRGEFGL